ncbi:hypothetical protein XI03_07700 [Bradyrhizobium sp. CCBAU 65884]|nr:hypothetical protein [Bradyrhizobium sp. CCBAU 65884]
MEITIQEASDSCRAAKLLQLIFFRCSSRNVFHVDYKSIVGTRVQLDISTRPLESVLGRKSQASVDAVS